MTTHTVPFHYSTGQTLTAKTFTSGDVLEDEASTVVEATNRKQRYVATFEDVAAGDYMMIYYVAGDPAGYELVRFTGVDGEVASVISQSSDSTIITAVSNLQTSVNTIDDFLNTEMPALTLAVAQIHDRTGYALTILAGAISDAGTSTETYVLTINSVVYTADYAGLDEGGNRGATTLSKV